MIKILRWLTGFIDFSFEGGFCEDFINGCLNEKLNIINIKKDEKALFASCPRALYDDICRIAEESGGRIILIKEKGAHLYIEKLEKRMGIAVGLLLCVCLINFLSGFIWNIEIKGNHDLSEKEITEFLDKNGFHRGVYSKNVDKDMLESLMMSSFEKVGWAHINTNGTSAVVEINEAVKKPLVYKGKGANITAEKDGLIIKAVVSGGWQKVKAGEAVTKGTCLVSGINVSGNKNEFEFAKGEFIAQVKEDINIKISRTQKYKAYKDTKYYKSLYFFGLNIPLTLKKNSEENFDESESTKYIVINKTELPLGIKTKTVKPYHVFEKELSDAELKDLAKKESEKYISSYFPEEDIINKNINISVKGDLAQVDGYLLCIENIGKEVIIKY